MDEFESASVFEIFSRRLLRRLAHAPSVTRSQSALRIHGGARRGPFGVGCGVDLRAARLATQRNAVVRVGVMWSLFPCYFRWPLVVLPASWAGFAAQSTARAVTLTGAPSCFQKYTIYMKQEASFEGPVAGRFSRAHARAVGDHGPCAPPCSPYRPQEARSRARDRLIRLVHSPLDTRPSSLGRAAACPAGSPKRVTPFISWQCDAHESRSSTSCSSCCFPRGKIAAKRGRTSAYGER